MPILAYLCKRVQIDCMIIYITLYQYKSLY